MNYCTIGNNQKINISDIPTLNCEIFREQLAITNLRPLSYFGCDWGEKIKIFALLADDEKNQILISSTDIDKNHKEYNSITQDNSQYHMFERELYEQFDIKPLNHPWLKPVRKNQDKYEFFKMQGEQTHEVAVGPIHAGVIEPGHFRFLCQGEKVYNLEIMLGYQHRGVEDLMVQNPTNQLAESICGDSVVAYNSAFSQIMETLSDTKITKKAQIIRRIALEAERIAIHIGDLGAILGDIAYMMGKDVFGVTRTLVINTMLEISGSRFARGLITTGGVNYDINAEISNKILNMLEEVKKIVKKMAKTALSSATVMSRFEKTGTVSTETAQELNLVGLMGRACGIELDTRFDFKDELYKDFERKPFRATNDASSRFRIRYKEIKESISFIKKLLVKLKEVEDEDILVEANENLSPDSLCVSIVESWRGELVHCAITDSNGKLKRYKIKDPSFNNWWGLSMALRNNAISDFPLCNKGFDLSYCGFDL